MRRCLVAIVLVIAACGADSPSRADQGRAIADAAGLPKDVGDFFASAAAGTTATYRLTRQTTGADGKPLQVTVTQRPPDLRVDQFSADGTVDSTIAVDGHGYQCTMTAGQWQCGELGNADTASSAVFGPDAVQAAKDKIAQQVADFDFRVEGRTIANVAARCLVTTRKPGQASDSAGGTTATLCISPEGVILEIDTPAGTESALDYTTTIPPDAFALPAAVGASSAPTSASSTSS
jgi:hypothetical protein